jgi:cell division septation protein DedD
VDTRSFLALLAGGLVLLALGVAGLAALAAAAAHRRCHARAAVGGSAPPAPPSAGVVEMLCETQHRTPLLQPQPRAELSKGSAEAPVAPSCGETDECGRHQSECGLCCAQRTHRRGRRLS